MNRKGLLIRGSSKQILLKENKTYKNNHNLPKKVYRYLDICEDGKERDDIDERLIDFISSKHLPRTQIEYANDIRHFKNYFNIKNNYELLLIKHTHAKKYTLSLNGFNPLSPSIIKRRLSVLKQLYTYIKNYAEMITDDEEMVKMLKNPFKIISAPKVQQDILKTSALTEKELNYLLSVIIPTKNTDLEIQLKQRDKLLILLHVQTGVRVDELLQVKLTSFKKHKENYISYTYISKGGNIKESLIEIRLYEIILSYCEKYGIKKNDCIFHPISQNPLNNRKDKSISQVYYRKLLENYGVKAGIKEKVKTHTLRATYITLLHKKGMDIQQIKDAVGHNSISMTSLYIKSYMDSKEEATKVMKDLLDY